MLATLGFKNPCLKVELQFVHYAEDYEIMMIRKMRLGNRTRETRQSERQQ